MKTHLITADQLTDGTYTGPVDLTAFDGHIEIAARLGTVKFTGWLRAAGDIRAKAGSGIKAGFSIQATRVTVKLRVFVGLCSWRLPTPEEAQLRATLVSGTLAFGEYVPPTDVAE